LWLTAESDSRSIYRLIGWQYGSANAISFSTLGGKEFEQRQ